MQPLHRIEQPCTQIAVRACGPSAVVLCVTRATRSKTSELEASAMLRTGNRWGYGRMCDRYTRRRGHENMPLKRCKDVRLDPGAGDEVRCVTESASSISGRNHLSCGVRVETRKRSELFGVCQVDIENNRALRDKGRCI